MLRYPSGGPAHGRSAYPSSRPTWVSVSSGRAGCRAAATGTGGGGGGGVGGGGGGGGTGGGSGTGPAAGERSASRAVRSASIASGRPLSSSAASAACTERGSIGSAGHTYWPHEKLPSTVAPSGR